MPTTKERQMLKRYAAAAILVAALIPPLAAAGPVTDSIWVVPVGGTAAPGARAALKYGDSFTAGYTTKASQPWGFAQCWANDTTVLGKPNQGTYTPGDVIWSGYRSLYSGGPVSAAFDLTDPIQGLWVGGGADCKLSLVKFSGGKQTVLATTAFTVSP
jgi:hypothetical protein